MTLTEKYQMRKNQLDEWLNEIDDMAKDLDFRPFADKILAAKVILNDVHYEFETRLNNTCPNCQGDGLLYEGVNPCGKKCTSCDGSGGRAA